MQFGLTWAVATQHPWLDEGGWNWDLVKQAAVVWARFLPRSSYKHLNSTLKTAKTEKCQTKSGIGVPRFNSCNAVPSSVQRWEWHQEKLSNSKEWPLLPSRGKLYYCGFYLQKVKTHFPQYYFTTPKRSPVGIAAKETRKLSKNDLNCNQKSYILWIVYK